MDENLWLQDQVDPEEKKQKIASKSERLEIFQDKKTIEAANLLIAQLWGKGPN